MAGKNRDNQEIPQAPQQDERGIRLALEDLSQAFPHLAAACGSGVPADVVIEGDVPLFGEMGKILVTVCPRPPKGVRGFAMISIMANAKARKPA